MSSSLELMLSSSYNVTLALLAVLSLFMYAMSFTNRNYSWVDRSWSILPVIYTWIHVFYNTRELSAFSFFTMAAFNNAAIFYALIVTIWGIRLTLHFARRGGYSRGGEDYRWSYLRSSKWLANPIVWELFAFCNITVFQMVLLWAITLPVINIAPAPITSMDALIGAFMFFFIVCESICDEQQQRFQSTKRRAAKSRERSQVKEKDDILSYGFCITGVFGHSRHANVFCEGCIWITLSLAASAHGQPAWWQWIGCLTLELLTIYSTACITEKITRQKYPLYAVYQKTTPMLFPSVRPNTARTAYLLQMESRKNK